MTVFKDFIFNKLPRYYQVNDVNINPSGDGTLKRYLQVPGIELDEQFIPFIENFTDLIDVINCDDKFLPLLGGILGYPPSIDGLNTTYRKILAYAVAIYKIKGTLQSFKILFNLIGLDIDIVEEIPKKRFVYDDTPTVDLYDDGNVYDSECDYCSGYTILYSPSINPCNGPFTVVSTQTLALIENIICFLNPINAIYKGSMPKYNNCDNVNLTFIEDNNFCGNPTNVFGLFDPTTNTTTIFWDGTGNFQLAYKLKTDTDFGTPIDITGNTYVITGVTSPNVYQIELRRKCTDTTFSTWHKFFLYTQNGIINETNHDIKPTFINYIINSPVANLSTDYAMSFTLSGPIKIIALKVNSAWVIYSQLINTSIEFRDWLNTLNIGTWFIDSSGNIVSLNNNNQIAKFAYKVPPDNITEIEIDFLQYGKRSVESPSIIKADYSIFIDYTNPIYINSVYVDGISLSAGVTVINQSQFLSWINGLGKGAWSADSNGYVICNNTFCFSNITLTISGVQSNIFFNQRNLIITDTTKALLSDYGIALASAQPIVIETITINEVDISGPLGAFSDLNSIINWFNGLGHGSWYLSNDGFVASDLNPNSFNKLVYHFSDLISQTIYFIQFNEKIQNPIGTLVSIPFPSGTVIPDQGIYLYSLTPSLYDMIEIIIPIATNPIPITGGRIHTNAHAPYIGFLDNGNLKFINVQVGTVLQLIIT